MDLRRNLSDSLSFLYHETFPRLDFYLLWLTRFLFLSIDAAALAHWKTFSFTKSHNDKLVSIAGGVSGVFNCLSRLGRNWSYGSFNINSYLLFDDIRTL